MKSSLRIAIATGLYFVAATTVQSEDNWSRWRGPDMNGIAETGAPPIEWSETNNVAWKIAIPGHGSSTPIIWGDLLYVLTAIPTDGSLAPLPAHRNPSTEGERGRPVEQEFKLLAIRRSDGSVVWERTATKAVPHDGKQQNNSYASSSATTDGEVIIAYFGSWGLYCYDMEGELKWSKDLGDMYTRGGFGEGATPALHGKTIVVQWDHERQSFIAAFDRDTGEERWRRDRDEVSSWGTPIVVEHDGRTQVVATGTANVTGYDIETGDIIWYGPGLTLNPIPSSVVRNGVLYATSGFRGSAAMAVRLADAKGDITGTSAILWQLDRDTPYVPSPLLYGDILYLVKSNNAILTALDPDSGRAHYGPVRLDNVFEIYASPVGVNGNVIILGRDGNALVLKNGPELEVLAHNVLDDGFDASPAFYRDEMYLRGYRHLYRISND